MKQEELQSGKKIESSLHPLLMLCQDIWRVILLYVHFSDHISVALSHKQLRFLVSQYFLNRCILLNALRSFRSEMDDSNEPFYYCRGYIHSLVPQWRSRKLKVIGSLDHFKENDVYLSTSFADIEKVSPLYSLQLPQLVFRHPSCLCESEIRIFQVGYWFYSVPSFCTGDQVDVMDDCGVWYIGRIVSVETSRILIHFLGWSSKWDQWYSKEDLTIAPVYTFTTPWRKKLETGDTIEFQLPHSQSRWYEGVIVKRESQEVVVKMKSMKTITEEESWVFPIESEQLCPHGTHVRSLHGYRRQHFCLNHPSWQRNLDPGQPRVSFQMRIHSNQRRLYTLKLLDIS